MPPSAPFPGSPHTEHARQFIAKLERYAGWLGRDAGRTRLQASVKDLALAVASGQDAYSALQLVQTDIDQLNSGSVAQLLRQTVRKLRAELIGKTG